MFSLVKFSQQTSEKGISNISFRTRVLRTYKRGTDLSLRVGPQKNAQQRPGKSGKKITEIPRAKGREESIPKESKEIGVEEQTLVICPRKEGPENDS